MLQKVGGNPPFALVGRRIVVRGIVTPYVAGQSVKVSFYRDGRKLAVRTVAVLAPRQWHGPVPRRFPECRRGAACRHARRTT